MTGHDLQPTSSNSAATAEASENSQEDCFPFLLDDEQQGVVEGASSTLKPLLFLASPSSSFLLPPTGRSRASLGASPPSILGVGSRDHCDDKSKGKSPVPEEIAMMCDVDNGCGQQVSSNSGVLLLCVGH